MFLKHKKYYVFKTQKILLRIFLVFVHTMGEKLCGDSYILTRQDSGGENKSLVFTKN